MSVFQAMRRRTAAGVTFVELFMVVTVVGVLSMSALPTARTVQRRVKEKQLNRALRDIRGAIDVFRKDWEQGLIEPENDEGWPESLEELTQEFEFKPLPGDPNAAKGPTTKTYLARIPRDPFNTEDLPGDDSGWGARSYEDDADSASWGGDGIYDVHSTSTQLALDGSAYETW